MDIGLGASQCHENSSRESIGYLHWTEGVSPSSESSSKVGPGGKGCIKIHIDTASTRTLTSEA